MKRRAIKITFFSIVGVAFTLTLVGFIFQDRIINAAMDNIRKNIRSRITIGDASFSLIKDFPYASIRLYDVCILSTKDINRRNFRRITEPDTLLIAGRLNIKLNVIDLINDKITIRQLSVNDGELNLLIDKKGRCNYQIIKKKGEASTHEVILKINSIKLKNTKFRFIDLSKQIALVNTFAYLKGDGNFSLEKFSIKTEVDVMVNQLAFGKINYVSNRRFDLKGKIKSNLYKSFNFKDFTISYKNNTINLDGGFSTGTRFFVDLSVRGKELNLKVINELIPKISKKLEKVNFEGKVNMSTKAKGFWTTKEYPFLYGDFDVRGGKSELLTDNSIASVNMVGSFSNGKGNIENAFVRFDSFKIDTNFGNFEGKFTLTNFNKPFVSLSSNFDLFISQLNNAYHIDSTNTLDGTVIGNITANGVVDFDSLSPLKLLRMVSNGNFKLSEMSFPINGNRYNILKGEISFIPTATKADVYFISNTINGNISATITNLYDGLMSQRPFTADITANTKNINFDNLLLLNFSKSKSAKQKELNLANLTLNISSKSAILRGVQMNNLQAVIEKNGQSITFSQLKANAFGGKVDMVGKLEPKPNKNIGADLYAQVDSIQIESLFKSFGNFGQTTITNRNIRGMASGDVAFRGEYTSAGKIDPQSVDCVANISINNGQLIKFDPAYKLSKFIDLKELEHIQFANLRNQISIKNGVITIPAMYIGSSAINLGIAGTHGFNGEYSYRAKLALKDILFKKARAKLKKQVSQEEFENNMLLYFKIEGNSKTSKVSYDWGGKSWDIPDKEAPVIPEKERTKTSTPATKPFKVQWDGEDVPIQKKVSTPTIQAKPAPAKIEKKEPAKEEEKKPPFKVEWQE